MSTKKCNDVDSWGDWISQAEAARLKGVTRQAINNLVLRGKLTTREVAGRQLVSKSEVVAYEPEAPGRPSADEDDQLLDNVMSVVNSAPPRIQRRVLALLGQRHGIHPIEREFGADAEVILEAIARSSDISRRGVRGLIAEASFKLLVLDVLGDWTEVDFEGEQSYDFLIRRNHHQLSIQVKMLRRQRGRPMPAREALRRFSDGLYVVETQRTRGGRNPLTGEDTRPYRFGDFDLLAVSMAPLTGDWSDFMYTVGDWLLPRDDDPRKILHFQPVPTVANEDWTNSLAECIERAETGAKKTISS